MNIMQKVRSVLLPEIGIDFEPEFVKESEISTDFTRTLAHLIGRTGRRSIVIKATSDGRLMVAAAGTAMEIYAVEAGDAEAAYAAADTFEFVEAQYVTDFLIETHDATISFRDVVGHWGDDKSLPVGGYSIDLINYGVRVQNRVGINVCDYEITTYR
ncbi:MAG: hypothetical protein GH151_10940 [Bacteroidetes bacterium]|nr:hypothetical protein [Bacteroidota bacterium]